MNIISVKVLASLIKQERKSQGWTQLELAERSGVSRDRLSVIANQQKLGTVSHHKYWLITSKIS